MPRNDKPSRHPPSKHAESNIKYPTAWSEWKRDDENQRYTSYCLVAPGQYEYDYKDYNTSTRDQASSSYQSTPATPYNYETTSQSSVSTIPTPYTSSNYAPASQSQTTSDLQSISESPPYTSTIQYTHKISIDNVTNNMQNMSLGDEKNKDPPKTGTVIRTRNRHKDTEIGPLGGPHYKVYHQNDFRAGKILILNWVEPSGSTKGKGSNWSEHTVITREPGIGKDGTEQYQKVRRFLIVKTFKGHCLGLPINTYSFQGVNKNGVHADNHAVIYSEYTPTFLPGEKEKGLVRPAILMVPNSPANKLHPASRLNYAKLYTIEYNVKVRFIGYVHESSGRQVAASYNEIHQAMEPLPGAYSQSQSLGVSSRSSQPSYGGTSTFYSVSSSYTNNAVPHSNNTGYGRTPSYDPSVPYSYSQTTVPVQNSGSSSKLSSGVPRMTPTYNPNYSMSPSNTQQPPYYTSQGETFPSNRYTGGGSGYQTDDYSNTGYSKREYENPDEDYHDK